MPRAERSGTDESPAGRNRVCTWGDEAEEALAHREAAGGSGCDVPMRGRASTRDCKPDPETGVAPGFTRCRNMRSRCRCSMCPAIHINSRSWLRSSSTHEPSDPPLRVVSRRRSSDDFASRRREAVEAGESRRAALTLSSHRNSEEERKQESSGAARPSESGWDLPHGSRTRLFKPLRRCFPDRTSALTRDCRTEHRGRARYPERPTRKIARPGEFRPRVPRHPP